MAERQDETRTGNTSKGTQERTPMSAGGGGGTGREARGVPYEAPALRPPTIGGFHSDNLKALDRSLKLVDFPASKNEVLESLGNEHLDANGRSISMRDVVRKLPQDRFEGPNDILRAVQDLPEFRPAGEGASAPGR